VPPRRQKLKVTKHPSTEEIAAFVSGQSTANKKEMVIAHLARCPLCRRLVAQVALSQDAVADSPDRPTRLGHC
jgi:anti-sigma factor RsiW